MASPQKVQAECPCCHTKHIVTFHPYDAVYLDGVPKLSMKKMMQRFVVCSKCGLVHSADQDSLLNAEHLLVSPQYEMATRIQYRDTTEQCLKLLDALYAPTYAPLFLAHYYNETKRHAERDEMLKRAIDNILNGKDCVVQSCIKCGELVFDQFFMLQPEYRLIDLYRQRGCFAEAIEQIVKIRSKPFFEKPVNLLKYLDLEEKLIESKTQKML